MPEQLPYLSGFAVALGDRQAIGDTSDPDVRAEAEALQRADLRHYRQAEEDLLAMAARCVKQTLGYAGERLPVTAAVYTSDTFTARNPSKALRTLLAGSGLDDVDGWVVGGRECDNLYLAVSAAEARLRADDRRAGVLVVTADQVTRGTRLNQDARTVMSDGAASCLVSWDSTGPAVRLRAMAALPVSPPAGAPPLMRARHHVTALRALSDQVFDAAGLHREQCAKVVTSNVGLNVAQMFRAAVGGRQTALYRPAAKDVGHCFSADALHTVGLLLEEPETAVGDIVLVVATSPHSCSLLLLEVAGTGPA
ncbi:hypothetical protein MRQ36_31225 [Micromonospora sp. R77]|uniref:hypothetical protein n=1 Tax=Micromonospora sp. R77 TaxID=2925836 RepID=UPI001F61081F|nr:hypothetical protein [Micromonospora sp. R77]MCI4066793.1 hypothetical protein [Micromonospora sp. R77]